MAENETIAPNAAGGRPTQLCASGTYGLGYPALDKGHCSLVRGELLLAVLNQNVLGQV